MESRDGLQKFGERLHPDAVQDLLEWERDPELGKVTASLRATGHREKFLNTYAEAMIARVLRTHGCDLQVEVPTPSGRSCDFEVGVDGHRFFVHVKRLSTDRAMKKSLTVSSRLRYLERIARPYVVRVRWDEGLTEQQTQRFVTSAADFIKHARVGDELLVHDDDGSELGGCRIVAPWEGTHVSLAIGLPSGFIDESPRIQRSLQKAYRQFMPREVNVIFVGTSHPEDVTDFEDALLGSHIERWDAHPPRGRRIAHGRAADGFWNGTHASESSIACWFHFDPLENVIRSRIWFRAGNVVDPALQTRLEELFNP